jgi:hypothetical protein
MHKLVMTLGKHYGQHFHDHKEYEKSAYEQAHVLSALLSRYDLRTAPGCWPSGMG